MEHCNHTQFFNILYLQCLTWKMYLIVVRLEGHCVSHYHDEVTLGNILSPDPSRKCCCFYITCLDWKHALHSEFAWFPSGILRSSIIRQTFWWIVQYCPKIVTNVR